MHSEILIRIKRHPFGLITSNDCTVDAHKVESFGLCPTLICEKLYIMCDFKKFNIQW